MIDIVSLQDSLGIKNENISKDKVDEYIKNLQENIEALDYLRVKRNLSDATIKHFKLGYNKSIDAISIPIYRRGIVVAIKYRFINPTDEKKKYAGEKGNYNWVFNEDGIEKAMLPEKKSILVVEGEFDCMSLWQEGILNSISVGGKDATGQWMERLDNLKRVYIAFDNDDAGRSGASKLAQRIGTEKCYEIKLPDDVKDMNDFFKKYSKNDLGEIRKESQPFYRYEFKGLGDIITQLQTEKEEYLEIGTIPNVKFENNWIAVISGVSNVGKTTYSMNIAKDVSDRGIPCLILPFERGVESVGRRYLSVAFDKTMDEFRYLSADGWEDVKEKCINSPVYLAKPKQEDILNTIVKSKKLFNTQVVIIDHLDYLIRNVRGNRESEISNTLHQLKSIAEQHKIVILIVSHIRKIESGNGYAKQRKPSMEDLKGSSSLYQDPEVVVMLSKPEDGTIEVDVLKNKGEMGSYFFTVKSSTGIMTRADNDFDITKFANDIKKHNESFHL
jgi:5S rRNA maturation endonuclease (ribonuclease M5)/KaiC/GvpD/RAD55 family RecA-like ATPase